MSAHSFDNERGNSGTVRGVTLCIMQTSLRATVGPPTGRRRPGLAAQFQDAWDEMAGFVLNRKLRAAEFHGERLDPSQLRALAVLDAGELGMRDLADRLGLAESSVTRLVDRLEAAGLAERHAAGPGEDRRRVHVRLTGDGGAFVTRVRAAEREFLKEILESLEPAERVELVRLFAKVAARLRERETAGSTTWEVRA